MLSRSMLFPKWYDWLIVAALAAILGWGSAKLTFAEEVQVNPPVLADEGMTRRAESGYHDFHTQVCNFYAEYTVYGSTQWLRGAAPEFVYLTGEEMIALIGDGATGDDKLYILLPDNEPLSEETKRAVESAVMAGYIAMGAWVATNGEDAIPPSNKSTFEVAHKACLKDLREMLPQ